MIIKKKKFRDLQIEEGKSYVTRFQSRELFFVKKVKKIFFKSGDVSVEKVIGYEGIYWNARHLGLCPLAVDRLIPERVEDGFIYVCDCCDKEVSLEDLKNLINE
jgi:hypothetical protein